MKKALKICGTLFAAYALIGFLIFPLLLKFFGQRALREHVNESAVIERVTANPFTWRLSVEGLQLAEASGEWSVAWERATVNLSVLTLFKFYPVLDQIQLEAPDISYVRRIENQEAEPEESDLGSEEPKDWREIIAEVNTMEIPKVRINLLEVDSGRVTFVDDTNATQYSQVIEPINFTLEDFTTVTNSDNEMHFIAVTETGAELEWTGNFTSQPLTSSGSFRLEGLRIHHLSPYYAKFIRFDLVSAVFGMQFDYNLNLSDLENLFSMQAGSFELTDVLSRPSDNEDQLISLAAVSVDGVSFNFPQQALVVESISVKDGLTKIEQAADGSINLLELVAMPVVDAQMQAAPTDAEAEFSFEVREISVEDYRIFWVDSLQSGLVSVEVGIPNILIQDVSSDLLQPFELAADYELGENGTAHFEGSVVAETGALDVALSMQNIPLSIGGAYANEFAAIGLDGGSFTFTGAVKGALEEGYRLTGQGSVDGLAISQGTHLRAEWGQLAFEGLEMTTQPLSMHVDLLTLDQPYAAYVQLPVAQVEADGGEAESDDAVVADTTVSEPLPDVSIDSIQVKAGTFKLTDQSIQPQVELTMSEVDVSVDNVSTRGDSPAEVILSALINQSLLSLNAKLYPADPGRESEVNAQLEALSLPGFSPYSGKAVGRKVAKGWFTIDSDWSVVDNKLEAKNKLLIDQFELGERVESEDALRLPLDFAISLLKGPNGEMDLSLPLYGDLSDPKVSIGQIVRKALVGLITSVATSPFKLLSGLVDTEADLSRVDFAAGVHELDAGLIDQLNALAKALNARPGIQLTMTSFVSDADKDSIARDLLREQVLGDSEKRDDATYLKKLKRAYKKAMSDGTEPVVEEPIEPASETEFVEKVTRIRTRPEFKRYKTERRVELVEVTKPVGPQAEEEAPDTSVEADASEETGEVTQAQMEAALMRRVPVDQAQVEQLARQREAAVRSHLIIAGGVDAARIFVIELGASEGERSGIGFDLK